MALALAGDGSSPAGEESSGTIEPLGGDQAVFDDLQTPDLSGADPNAGVSIVRDDGTGKPAVVILPDDGTKTSSDTDGGQPPTILPEPPIEGSPRASLTYQGVTYYQNPLSTPAALQLNVDDLEQVGLTTDSNTLMPGEENGLDVYRVKGGEATDVFTYVPSSTWVNPEDGQTVTSPGGWLRWSA